MTPILLNMSRLSLFGILSSGEFHSVTPFEEDSFFCFKPMKCSDLYSMLTPCCWHLVHCTCFRQWLQRINSCAYCREPYNKKDYCCVCLTRFVSTQPLRQTTCCKRQIHAVCYSAIKKISKRLPERKALDCHQTLSCTQIIYTTREQTLLPNQQYSFWTGDV